MKVEIHISSRQNIAIDRIAYFNSVNKIAKYVNEVAYTQIKKSDYFEQSRRNYIMDLFMGLI